MKYRTGEAFRAALERRLGVAVVALAGPLATLALAGLWGFLARALGPLDRNPTPAQAVCLCLYAVELLQGVLNLVPLGPLDGALALRSSGDCSPGGARSGEVPDGDPLGS